MYCLNRRFRNSRGFIGLLAAITLISAACTSQSPLPTAAVLPTVAGIVIDGSTTVPPTQESGIVPSLDADNMQWGQRPFGVDKVSMIFFVRDAAKCIRLIVENNAPVEQCTVSGTIVATQFTATDSTGKPYTVIAGRTLNDKIIVVSIELDRGDNTPVDTERGGFMTILEGSRKAVAIVPIDNLGNLIGARYLMR